MLGVDGIHCALPDGPPQNRVHSQVADDHGCLFPGKRARASEISAALKRDLISSVARRAAPSRANCDLTRAKSRPGSARVAPEICVSLRREGGGGCRRVEH